MGVAILFIHKRDVVFFSSRMGENTLVSFGSWMGDKQESGFLFTDKSPTFSRFFYRCGLEWQTGCDFFARWIEIIIGWVGPTWVHEVGKTMSDHKNITILAETLSKL
jgi:hypothetical protein